MASQAIATTEPAAPVNLSPEAQHFSLMQRKAGLFAASPLIPDALRAGGPQQALANCYIGLTMAEAMGENPLTVLQNIHIVKGKAGFSAQFMIARANASGVFKGRINWRMKGQGETLSAEAYATLAETGEEVSFTVDMTMANAEGWTSNPKYKSVPHLMLRYRSATFLVRLYAPDVMFGYQTAEEVEDVAYAAIPEGQPLSSAMLLEQARPAEDGGPQGPDDSDRGEAFADDNAAEMDPYAGEPWAERRREIIDGFNLAQNNADLKKVDALLVQHLQAFPDAVQAELEKVAADARGRLAA